MKRALLLGALALISACSPKVVATSASTADSVRVEIRERIIVDTVVVEIPSVSEIRETRDTSSHLENDYALSDASICQGLLTHSLKTKAQRIPAAVMVPVHDTIVEEVHIASEVQTVEVERELTWWQKFWITFGKAACAILIIGITAFVVSRLTPIGK